jgi:large subunit ribosomal protein L3
VKVARHSDAPYPASIKSAASAPIDAPAETPAEVVETTTAETQEG